MAETKQRPHPFNDFHKAHNGRVFYDEFPYGFRAANINDLFVNKKYAPGTRFIVREESGRCVAYKSAPDIDLDILDLFLDEGRAFVFDVETYKQETGQEVPATTKNQNSK